MKNRSDSSWRYQGSTLLLSSAAIAELLRDHAEQPARVTMISLRTSLRWCAGHWPAPLSAHSTCVITGLETLLQTLPPPQVEQVLLQRVRAMITAINRRWPQTGLVFPLPVDPASLTTNFDEEIVLRRNDKTTIQLSSLLWGSYADDITEFHANAERIAYHVSRLS